MFQEDILLTYGATFRKYRKGQCIFFEGDCPLFYYQISEGSVGLVNIFPDGRELIQGVIYRSQSFGEPPLLLNCHYAVSAVAHEDTVVLKLTRENFLHMLHCNESLLYKFAVLLAERLFTKTTLVKEITKEKPQHRIITLLKMLKKQSGFNLEKPFKIELSRQRIADMLGLRVETVIRTMKLLEEQGQIMIKHGKAYV